MKDLEHFLRIAVNTKSEASSAGAMFLVLVGPSSISGVKRDIPWADLSIPDKLAFTEHVTCIGASMHIASSSET